jgi:hypothetical protein
MLNLLTPCSRVLLEKLTGSQLFKKFPTFYGTRWFIVAFKTAATCPCPEPDQSSLYPHIPVPEDTYKFYPSIYSWVFQFTLL